jgi:hypothetical protein
VPLSCKIAFACTPTFACPLRDVAGVSAQGTLCSASFVEAQRSTYPPVQGASCCTGRRGLTVTEGVWAATGCIGIAAAAETCTHRSGELLPSADAQRSVVWPRAAQKSIAWSTARVSSPMKRGIFVSKQQARALQAHHIFIAVGVCLWHDRMQGIPNAREAMAGWCRLTRLLPHTSTSIFSACACVRACACPHIVLG